jgi:hypothetical protein
LTRRSGNELFMRKGHFVNQKLGKRVSRNVELLRAELAGRTKPKTSNLLDLKFPKKGTSREGKP